MDGVNGVWGVSGSGSWGVLCQKVNTAVLDQVGLTLVATASSTFAEACAQSNLRVILFEGGC